MAQARRVLIAGGGPAGLLAGLAAARAGASAIIFEKNGLLGRKLAISGGGRANLTNLGDHRHLADAFGKPGRFLFSALSKFDNRSLIRLMEEIGVKVKEEDHGRIFPVSDSAKQVVDALERALLAAGATIHKNMPVEGLLVERAATNAPTTVTGLRAGGKAWRGEAIIVTTGGVSFPKTGATGDAFPWLADLGHGCATLKPGLAPLLTPKGAVEGLMGLSLRGVGLTLFVDGKKAGRETWDLLFAHFGLTGPAPLSLSHLLPARRDWKPSFVELDALPELDGTALRSRLREWVGAHPARQLDNLLATFRLPPRFLEFLIRRAGLLPGQRGGEVGTGELEALALAFKKLRFEVTGPGPMDGAMVTAGGVPLAEIDPKTMASRMAEGLFVAGEILDLAAKSGGYNLQAAWSTGWVAGLSAAAAGTNSVSIETA